MKIALTGGIACGKSMLAKFLTELGIRLLDADDIVHELESSRGQAVSAIVARFGKSVLAQDGSIDRAELAKVVFADANAREDLEQILFPYVRSRLREFAEGYGCGKVDVECRRNEEMRISVIPLLFESHWEGDYDIIVSVASPKCQQVDRMVKTRGYSREQAEARLAAQMPVGEKAARSDFVVMNDSTPEHLKEEAGRLYAWLKERTKHEQ